jgi:hypothetical protein
MNYKIFFLISFFTFCYAQSDHITLTPQLQLLLDDMKLYKFDSEGDIYLHAGDLYEHSIWTYNAMWELFRTNSVYVHNLNLTERQKEIVTLAALLHDIGKAGRLELFEECSASPYDIIKNDKGIVTKIIYYQDHQQHPKIGFEYAGKDFFEQFQENYLIRNYWIMDRKTAAIRQFDMHHLFDELGLTYDEQKIVTILIGIHYEFGNLKHNEITIDQFLSMLKNFVKVVDYNEGNLDDLILRLAILIQVADVKGLTPVDLQASTIFPEGIECKPTHSDLKFENPFKELGYEAVDGSIAVAFRIMNNVVNYFHEKKNGSLKGDFPLKISSFTEPLA